MFEKQEIWVFWLNESTQTNLGRLIHFGSLPGQLTSTHWVDSYKENEEMHACVDSSKFWSTHTLWVTSWTAYIDSIGRLSQGKWRNACMSRIIYVWSTHTYWVTPWTTHVDPDESTHTDANILLNMLDHSRQFSSSDESTHRCLDTFFC